MILYFREPAGAPKLKKDKVINMYMDDYKRWAAAELEDPALTAELQKIEGQDEEIKDRFAVALKFGTAGLRGVLGAGTNRMNIYVVRQATQGLANWVKTQAAISWLPFPMTAVSTPTFSLRKLPGSWLPTVSRSASMTL